MIRLHHVAQSRSFRVLWLLEELGLPYELVHHSFFDKSLRAPEYLAISPAGRVPAVELAERDMFESGAILQHLCEAQGFLPPPAERPDWLEWVHFAETIASHVANLTQQHIVLRAAHMRSVTVMQLEARRLEKTLGVIEAALTDGYLLRSGFSAADIAVSYGALIGRRFVGLEDLPRLQGWIARLESRPAFQRAQDKDGMAQIYLHDFYPAPDS